MTFSDCNCVKGEPYHRDHQLPSANTPEYYNEGAKAEIRFRLHFTHDTARHQAREEGDPTALDGFSWWGVHLNGKHILSL